MTEWKCDGNAEGDVKAKESQKGEPKRRERNRSLSRSKRKWTGSHTTAVIE